MNAPASGAAVLLSGMQEGSAAVVARALGTTSLDVAEAEGAAAGEGGVLLAAGVGDADALAQATGLAQDTGRKLLLLDPEVGAGWAPDPAVVAAAVVTRAAHARRLSEYVPELIWLRLPMPLDERALLAAMQVRARHRSSMQVHLRLGAGGTWLLGPGGDTTPETWTLLGRCAARAVDEPWCLVVTPAPGESLRAAEAALRGLPADRVRIWPAPKPTDLMALVLSCDVCLWPAADDADLELLLLAQAAGLPAVAGTGPAGEECVRDSLTGRVLPAGNIESMANALRFLLRQRAFAETMGRQAREAVLGEHGLAPVGRALAGFLQRWLQ